MSLAKTHGRELIAIARQAVAEGLRVQVKPTLDLGAYPAELRTPRATFVTLTKHSELRGCIGVLEPCRPLARDVAENAYAAAFEDPRFSPLKAFEFDLIRLHISLLTPAEPLSFASEREALAQLRPGVDGLILREGGRRSTFLPSVWQNLADPALFLGKLKEKANLPAFYWSDTLELFRYECEQIDEKDILPPLGPAV